MINSPEAARLIACDRIISRGDCNTIINCSECPLRVEIVLGFTLMRDAELARFYEWKDKEANNDRRRTA
jgi:hypothetical protein